MNQVLTMSQKEVDRVSIVSQILTGQLSLAQTTGLPGLGERQVYRIINSLTPPKLGNS